MREYQETIQYLYNLQYSGIKLRLNNITQLLKYLGNPQNNWPAIHIAGTNGKGSVAAFLHSILFEAGYKVGRYTSPHLIDFTERIQVNEERISWQEIVDYTNDIRKEVEKYHSTFFETTSAIAFRYFAKQNVDIAVIETGLGGRLDATNMVHPIVSLITSISKDHSQFLGTNLKKIAQEKAGIIKENIPCTALFQSNEILTIIKNKCKEKKAPLFILKPSKHIEVLHKSLEKSNFNLYLPERNILNLEIPLAGFHQITNAALALSALLQLSKFPVSEQNIKYGLKKTVWPARLQKIQENPLTLLDVAHNPDGFVQVFSFLRENYPNKKIWALIGLSKDKDYKKITDIISGNVSVIGVITHFSERALSPDILMEELRLRYQKVFQFKKVEEGFNQFKNDINKNDILLIVGSHYLAGDFLQKTQFT